MESTNTVDSTDGSSAEEDAFSDVENPTEKNVDQPKEKPDIPSNDVDIDELAEEGIRTDWSVIRARVQKLVSILNEIATKMQFSVIDMYNDKNFNNISAETYALYMADPVHPTKAGYYYWLTPYIESHLFAFFH